MAFTNSPENSTYRTVELEFTEAEFKRSNSFSEQRDSHIVNFFYDESSNENKTRTFRLVKRPGLQDSGLSNQLSSLTGQEVIGMFYNDSSNEVYWATSQRNVYYLNLTTGIGSLLTIATFTNTRPKVGFTMFLNSTGTKYLCFTNGDELFYMDSAAPGAATEVTDPDLPVPHLPYPVFVDGYLFLGTSRGDIYNSDLDNQASWTSGDYITAEIDGDFLRAIAKVKNYIVAFGGKGIEFFYDAANLSGSPLGRNESYYHSIGYYDGLSPLGDDLYFVGYKQNQGLQIFRLRENEITPVSNFSVNRILNYANSYSNATTTTNPNPPFAGFAFSTAGHNFYLISVHNATTFENINYVVDIDLGFWYEWPMLGARVSNICNTPYARPFVSLNVTSSNTAGVAVQNFMQFNPSIYQDNSSNFTSTYITQHYDAGTFNWKTCGRTGLICNQHQATGTSNVGVQWSDDNGASFSTARNINVFSDNSYIRVCGRFRARNWKLTYTDNYPLWIEKLSLDLNIGVN